MLHVSSAWFNNEAAKLVLWLPCEKVHRKYQKVFSDCLYLQVHLTDQVNLKKIHTYRRARVPESNDKKDPCGH